MLGAVCTASMRKPGTSATYSLKNKKIKERRKEEEKERKKERTKDRKELPFALGVGSSSFSSPESADFGAELSYRHVLTKLTHVCICIF